ncbi:MAG: bifunctional non-ous end joining protein LigD [Gemmatimonadaceae bacterium]|nr:bifunctional non-ous end joining protein LigD [Gemmatimonadaceae bacterium]
MGVATSGSSKRSARAQLAEYQRKRDFKKTDEPSGDESPSPRRAGRFRFVIQKHAASHLHFDLRLELDGVMKSWAVPKGPSLDPSVKRLAMQVEDHPIDYNTFEGTIPKGEYGGGTVMLWDRGTYSSDVATSPEEEEGAIREGLKRGDLKITFHGERLHGSYALIRMKFARDGSSSKPQWLLIKHRDEFAAQEDVVAENMTSVDTGRTMEEIASGKSKVWRSNREPKKVAASSSPKIALGKKTSIPSPARLPFQSLEPMYASVGTEVPGEGWTFEPKYDGIRVLAYATPAEVKLITRNGKDKAQQFPEIVAALKKLASQSKRSFVLDGEIVALTDGEPARFQQLQSRMHVKESHMIARHSSSTPAALILFDILMDGEEVLIKEPWSERRGHLVKRVGKRVSTQVRLTESVQGDGKKMLEQARQQGWEGIIAKRVDSRYEPGNRSRNWLKLKIEFRQEFVVGGYTEPRNGRAHIGALLLGYFDHDRFIYVGHTGGGFTRQGLEEMYRRLKPLERKTSPFEETPKTNERAHWVKPEVVVEVKFNEWTADRRLRQPIFLGVRDDKDPKDVGLEATSVQRKSARGSTIAKRKPRRTVAARAKTGAKASPRKIAGVTASPVRMRAKVDKTSLLEQLTAIEEKGGDGSLDFGDGKKLKVSNLDKVFFPKEKYTKGDVMRYYTRIADFVLPVMQDRPLVLKRFPNGIDGESFYQQKASETTPGEVRVEVIETEGGEKQPRIIGGDLLTLLYTIQLGAISVDPWHSRVQSLEYSDYTIIDLDPGPRANFARVIQVARWAKEVIDGFGLNAAIKTSGSTGLHIYLPLPPRTPNDAATIVAQMIATKVAAAHPKEATIERFVKARGAATVYVDYLQNIQGKTVAAAYSVRAKPGATVSAPLKWSELTDDLDLRAFQLGNAAERFEKIGDIWGEAMRKKNSLRALV